MSSLNVDIALSRILAVVVSNDTLSVELEDGRAISVPLPWFPRLQFGTSQERNNWRLIGGGEGIHWPDLDEDVSAEDLIVGRRSMESLKSLKKWQQKRKTGDPDHEK